MAYQWGIQKNGKEPGQQKTMVYKVVIVCLGILLLGSFWLTMRMAAEPLSLVVRPSVPRESEPILVTFKLSNPMSHHVVTDFQFYANGEFLAGGTTTVAPMSQKTYQYAYENPLRLGEQVNFVVKSQSKRGNFERVVSLPPAPPQIWSSFVSFASFSTSVMSSMSTMTYYQTTFGRSVGTSISVVVSAILMVLLVFLELSFPVLARRSFSALGRLRLRFSTVSWILLIIFMGIVYTTIITIIST